MRPAPRGVADRGKLMEATIHAEGLVKRFGKVTALDGLDLSVAEGTVLGLLGPNGAGKTTAVSILTTLLEPDEGVAHVAGADVRRDPAKVRERIGLSGQYAAVDEHLTGYENLDMIARLYRLGRTRSRERSRELLEEFGLSHAGDRPVKTYSGGMRRRLDLAGALVARPSVLFLDEPTTGLDPRSRTDLWGVIRQLVDSGATLLLTTQYLEEADQLADEILVVDQGKAIARGTADQLKAQVGGERIEIVVSSKEDIGRAQAVLSRFGTGEMQLDLNGRGVTAPIDGGARTLRAVLEAIEEAGFEVSDVGLRRPTLDDVFLTLTGHVAEQAEDDDGAPDEGGDSPVTGPLHATPNGAGMVDGRHGPDGHRPAAVGAGDEEDAR